MPILSGSASLTRFNVTPPDELDFESEEFRELAPGSEVRESIGFLPFEPGADYQIGVNRWAFRVRIDRLVTDATLVRERLADLLRVEAEQSGGRISAAKRKELKNLAQEELLHKARTVSNITECVIDGSVLHIATTANNTLGKIVLLLRKLGVIASFKTPWIDLGEDDAESEIMEVYGPDQSMHGSSFLKGLIGDDDVMIEPVEGWAKLATHNARIAISGKVLNDVVGYVEDGAELLAAKLISADLVFKLDALSFRVSGLSLRRPAMGHWTERLDERLEQIDSMWELLDTKYSELRRPKRRGRILTSNPPADGNRPDDTPEDDNVVAFDTGRHGPS